MNTLLRGWREIAAYCGVVGLLLLASLQCLATVLLWSTLPWLLPVLASADLGLIYAIGAWAREPEPGDEREPTELDADFDPLASLRQAQEQARNIDCSRMLARMREYDMRRAQALGTYREGHDL